MPRYEQYSMPNSSKAIKKISGKIFPSASLQSINWSPNLRWQEFNSRINKYYWQKFSHFRLLLDLFLLGKKPSLWKGSKLETETCKTEDF